MNKAQVELAIKTGLALLGDESEISVPVKLNDGVFLLKQLLISIAQGQLGLTPVVQPEPPELTPVDPSIDPPDDGEGEPEGE